MAPPRRSEDNTMRRSEDRQLWNASSGTLMIMMTQAIGEMNPSLSNAAHAFDVVQVQDRQSSTRSIGALEQETANQLALAIRDANLERMTADIYLPALGASPGTKDTFLHVPLDNLHLASAQEERRLLVEHAMRTQDQDNGPLLSAIRQRMNLVGMELPTVEVRFEDLNINASVAVGDRSMPSLTNYVRDQFEMLLSAMHLIKPDTRCFKILHKASGVLKPGRLTLLLGPPSSGKSTLLKALAGALKDAGHGLSIEGSITYNNEAFDRFQVRRTASYIEQVDNHMGELTVRETLDFGARLQGAGLAQELRAELQVRETAAGISPEPVVDAWLRATGIEAGAHSMATELQLRLLGLDVCADTFVGGQMIRGVSGGQKKRVTTGEMLVGPQRVLMLDEISTGLDSSTTKLITNCLLNLAHEQQATVLVALLQPPPEVYDLFDDILLLSDGRVIFHGPRTDVVPFFESLGFACPERKGVADFLQEVTSQKDQSQYWADGGLHDYFPVEAMVEAFTKSPAGLARTADLSRDSAISVRVSIAVPDISQAVQPVHKTEGKAKDLATTHWASENWPPDPLVRTSYALSGWNILLANLARDWILMKRLSFLWGFKVFQTIFVSAIFGTLFLKSRMGLTPADGQLYLGIIFFSMVNTMFNGYVEMSILVSGLRVFFKQRNAQFFPPWTYTIPSMLLRIPWSAVDSFLWTLCVYWTTGMAPSAGRFFIFWAYMFMISQLSLSMFRFVGALARNYDTANSFGSTTLIVSLMLAGFILARPSINIWTKWLYWANPITYAQLGLSINEMSHPRWAIRTVFQGVEMTVGEAVLAKFDMSSEKYFVWLGILVMLGYFILFQVLMFVCLTLLNEPAPDMPAFSEEFLAAREANLTGLGIKTKSRSLAMTPVTSLKDGTVLPQHVNEEQGEQVTLPFKPTSVSFHGMVYAVPMPAQDERHDQMRAAGDADPQLVLLNNITGSFRPGVLTALMGVSGAGKTTLMDVLAGRKTQGTITGDMRVNGHPVNQDTFARVCGYVEQADLHIPRTTVREALAISALLRLPKTDRATVETFVDEVMNLVELGQQAHSLVGLPGQFGLSVEQRKRLTIGVELVANPSVVFADEPTSGLDARAAAIVMRAVRNTVNTGRTVVCTIHQPSVDIFESFDELLLLKRGGNTIFHGAIGKQSASLIAYFQSFKGVSTCPTDLNPATWMLEVSSFAAEGRLSCNFAELYSQSSLAKSNETLVLQLETPAEGSEPLAFGSVYSRDVVTQFVAILKRNFLSYWRNPSYNAIRFIFSGILGCILGAIFWDLGTKRGTPTEVFNLMGALLICITFLGTYNANGVLPVLATERPVFYRERASKMYSALPYALAQAVVEVPYVALQSILYAIITYFLIQFELSAIKFLWYLLFTFLTLSFFTFYGCMIVSLCAIPELALLFLATSYGLWFVFAGFFIAEPLMPRWWFWLHWLDPLSYALYGLIGSQLSNVYDDFVTLPDGTVQTVSAYVESSMNLKYSFIGPAAGILAGFIIGFWLIYLFATIRLNFNKR